MKEMIEFVKVAAASPITEVGNCSSNIKRIEEVMIDAYQSGTQILTFPELCITGYSCMDLFAQEKLLSHAEKALLKLVKSTMDLKMLTVVGMPLRKNGCLYNVAVAFSEGKILGIVPKTYIPNYKEFQEQRWFSSGRNVQKGATVCIDKEEYPFGTDLIFSNNETKSACPIGVGIELCEDLWSAIPPSSYLALNGANIILNLSASNETAGKHEYLRSLILQQSARCISAYVYASSGYGESSTDLVYAGKGFIAENGNILKEAPRFNADKKLIESQINIGYLNHDRRMNTSFRAAIDNIPASYTDNRHISFSLKGPGDYTLTRVINSHPFVPPENKELEKRCDEILNIQTTGLMRRLQHIGASSAVIGISGGLDSTLALMVTVRAFDKLELPRENILGVTMPGFGTSDRTYTNAKSLISSLGVTLKEINIKDACVQHFKDIGHDGITTDAAYENTQARERTQILMDLANKENAIVIGTGDLSELALGWATYNGDHMSMYNVNVSIPKTLVRFLVKHSAEKSKDKETKATLFDICDTPVSPELTPADKNGKISQKTEDIIGPYELHDFFLYHFIRFGASPEKIIILAKHAFNGKYEEDEIKKWLKVFLRRFFSQQFKRNCLPDGPKVGSISLSPRSDWRMPSDAIVSEWLEGL